MITCPLCQNKFGVLTNTHLANKHDLQPAEFDALFPRVARWSNASKHRLAGNKNALGYKHTAAFNKLFRKAVSKPRPAAVIEKIRATWRKRLSSDPEFAAQVQARGRRAGKRSLR